MANSDLGAYNKSDIQAIADAIRSKNGSSDLYRVSDMPDAISHLSGDTYPIEAHTDGNTHAWIESSIFTSGGATYGEIRLNLYMYGDNHVSVDWGDGQLDSHVSRATASWGVEQVSRTFNETVPTLHEIVIKDYIVTSIDPETEEIIYTNHTNRDRIKLGGNGTGYPFVFSSMTGLKAIEISHNVSGFAFYNCRDLENVLIHVSGNCNRDKTCDSIGDEAFENCYALNKFIFDGEIDSLDTFTWDGNNHFYYAVSLKEIVIPNGLTSLPQLPFRYCYNLKSVTFPESMVDLGNDIMTQCPSMESITIPENVTSFSIQSGSNKNLTTLIMKPVIPPTMPGNLGDRNNSGFTIIVPRGSLEAYQTANYWSTCASKMVEADE